MSNSNASRSDKQFAKEIAKKTGETIDINRVNDQDFGGLKTKATRTTPTPVQVRVELLDEIDSPEVRMGAAVCDVRPMPNAFLMVSRSEKNPGRPYWAVYANMDTIKFLAWAPRDVQMPY